MASTTTTVEVGPTRPVQLLGRDATTAVLIANTDKVTTVFLSSREQIPDSSTVTLGPGKSIQWPAGTTLYAIAEVGAVTRPNILVIPGGSGYGASAAEIADEIGAVGVSGIVAVSNLAELRGVALKTLTDVVDAVNGAGGVARNVNVQNFPATQPISEAHLANLNLTLTALRDALVTGLGRPAGAVPHFDSRRINANATTTITAADAYLSTLVLAVSNAGAGWTIAAQSRDAAPRYVSPPTAAALGVVVLHFPMPVLLNSGIDIVTAAGAPAGVVDVFTSYFS